jgi:hypothetical protein
MLIRRDSSLVEHSVPLNEGGSIPTSLLHLKKGEWWVAPVSRSVAEKLVIEEHYARGAANTGVAIHGLFRRGCWQDDECLGVAWWIPPTKSAAQAWSPSWKGVLALSRLAIRPDVPKNAASFLISKSVKLIDRTRWHTLISYADSWRGHTGAIYRAAGWEYCGQTQPQRCYTLNGRMTARKAGPYTRTHQEMLELGCQYEGSFSKARFCLRNRDPSAISGLWRDEPNSQPQQHKELKMPSTLRVEATFELPDDAFDAAPILTAVKPAVDTAEKMISEALGRDFFFDVTIMPAKKPRAPRGSKKAAANGAGQSTQQNPNFAA